MKDSIVHDWNIEQVALLDHVPVCPLDGHAITTSGPKGAPGPQGAPGPVGPTGPIGPTGP